MAAVLKDFGTVRRFRAGTGEPDSTLGEVKLADYLKREGYRVVYVGGAPPAEGRERHMAEHVLSELRRQAANVVATGEGKVLAYAGNPRTQAALEQAGIAVTVFPGLALMGANGGPHCLTQPLERE
jgi:siroheme synthase